MKITKLEYGSKGMVGGDGEAESWSDESATDGTGVKHGFGKRTPYKEAKKAGSEEPTKRSLEPIWGVERELRRCGLKAGEDGKKWAGARVCLGKDGQKVGKWTGFSRIKPALTRLFPHVSTQVVDFPHLNAVSIFSGGAKNDRISGRGMIGRGMGDEGQAELGTNVGKWSGGVLEPWESLPAWRCRGFLREESRIFSLFFVNFHDFTHTTGPYLRDFWLPKPATS